MKQPLHKKTKIISNMLLSLGLVFVLGSAIAQAHGEVVTIGSTGDVTRGANGSFVVNVSPPINWGGTRVNFSVSGTAIPGVDYVPLVSPVAISPIYCGPRTCYLGVIPVKTLPDPRASFFRQAYSVVVTLEPGWGYTIGEPSSAQTMINP